MGVPISSLPTATTLTGAELVPVVQSGQTKQTTTGAMPYNPPGTGSVPTTTQAKLQAFVSRSDYNSDANYNTARTALVGRNDFVFRSEGGTIDRLLSDKFTPLLDAKDFGAIPNTGTDQSAALQAYLDQLNALGGGVFSPTPGVYRCDTPLTTYANIRWLCYGVTLDFSYRSSYMSTLDQGLIVARGTAASQVLFSADAAADATGFTASSVSGLAVGDLLELSLSTGNIGNWTDSSIAVFTGQLNYITSISGSTVGIDSVIYDPMTVADGARYRKITPLKGVVIEGLTVKGKGRDVSGPGDVGISLFMCDGPVVKNCTMIGVDLRSINFVSCINFTATGNLLKFDPQGSNTNVNYGITYSSSRDGEIAWNQAYNMRHGIVSSHLSSALTNKYYGISRNVRVHHNTVGNAWHAGIATHNDVELVFVHENTIRDSAFGVNLRDRNAHAHRNIIENSAGAALYLSAKPQKQTFIGNIIKNCAVGVATSSLNTGWKMQDIQVDGTVIDGGAAAIVFTPDGTSGVNTNINVTGTKAANLSGPGGAAAVIRYNGAVQGTIAGNEIYNCSNISGVSIAATASKVRVMRNVVTNIGLTAFVMSNATGSLCAFNYYAGYTSGITGVTGVTLTSNTDGGSTAI